MRADKTRKRPRGFVPLWRPQKSTQERLHQVKQILLQYVSYLPLSCRQIFYVLVSTNGYPKTERAYKSLCEMLAMARRAEVLEFAHIRDDSAPVPRFIGFDSAVEFLDVVKDQARNLRLDRQARTYPAPFIVLLCEAGGMVPQLERVADQYSVPVLGCGGFDSLTAKHQFAAWCASLRRPVEVLHIGDHDPSGVHIFSSFAEDVAAFSTRFGGEVSF